MSGPVNIVSGALIDAVMAALRADAGVRAFFGHPARIIDAESQRPFYPYAELLSAEVSDVASAATPGGEHRITFAVHVRNDSKAEAARGLSALVSAIQSAEISLPGARIALVHPVYLDVVPGRQPLIQRGLLRLRIVTEQETEE